MRLAIVKGHTVAEALIDHKYETLRVITEGKLSVKRLTVELTDEGLSSIL